MSTKNNSNSTENNSKAIIFARVSTESQDYTEQVNRMKRVALADEYKEENLIVISNKESAIKLAEEERQGLQQLKDAVKNNPAVNAVYVFEISRLGRRMDVIASVVNWLKDNHIQLVCDEPNIRLFERSGKVSQAAEILIYLMGVLAEQEMKIKKERFANGKKRAKSLGRFTGGSVKWGYTLNQKKETVVDESKTNIIITIFSMYVDGQGNEAIANYMTEMGIAFRKSKTYTRSRVAKFICDEQYRKIVVRGNDRLKLPWTTLRSPPRKGCAIDLYSMLGISALILIDRDGTIIAVPNSVEELKAKLEEIFPDNK